MRITHVLAAALTMATIAGCSSNGSSGSIADPAPSGTLDPRQEAKVQLAVAMAREIRANPGNADQIFQKYNSSEAQFEALMYEIAADPMMTADYNARVGN